MMTNSLCTKKEKCTESQKKASVHFKGPLLVVAGPGAGKTRVLVERVAYLVKRKSVLPENILVITFTVKAAEELKARLSHCIGPDVKSMQVSTIHSFCHEILQEYSDFHEFGATFDVLDEEMQLMFIRSNFYKIGLKGLTRMSHLPEIVQFFNKCSENCISPEDLAKHLKKRYPDNEKYQGFSKAYGNYLDLLEEERKIDFPGLQQEVLKVLSSKKEVLDSIRSKYQFILVDEYQDTNPIQDKFFELISQPNKNICVVGDEDQSIYAFRGADPWNFIRFKEKYGSNYVTLDKNFRSTSNIVNLFDHFMESYRHYPKKIEPSRECGNSIIVLKSEDVHEEAKSVVQTIKEMKNRGIIPHYGYVALLFRSVRYHGQKIINELKKEGIPYTVKGQGSFLQRSEIQTMLYMLSYVDPPDYKFAKWKSWWNLSMFKTEFLNLKAETINALVELEKEFDISTLLTKLEFQEIGIEDEEDTGKLMRLNLLKKEMSEKRKDILSLFYEILDISGYLKWLITEGSEKSQEKIYNLAKLTTIINKYEYMNKKPKIKDLMWYLNLLPKGMEYDEETVENPHSVKLMTVHQAKGLEFPVVFVCSVIKNRFPGRKRRDKTLVPIPEELLLKYKSKDVFKLTEDTLIHDEFEMEERRLFYVAMTRAQDILVVSTADKINVKKVGYSPYVKEIEKIEKVLNKCDLNEMCEKRDLKDEKPVSLSYSSIDTYSTCPFRYQMMYEYGFEYPPSYMQNYGTILHNCLHKIHLLMKEHEKIDGVLIKHIVDKCWVPLYKNEKKELNQKRILERDLYYYYKDMKDHIQNVKSTEEPFSIAKQNMEINGRTDLIIENVDGETELVDFKARARKGIEETNVEFQLKMYEYALKDQYNFDKICAYTFKDRKRTYFDSDSDDIDEMNEDLDDICEKISNQEFEPRRNEFCHLCVFKFCC